MISELFKYRTLITRIEEKILTQEEVKKKVLILVAILFSMVGSMGNKCVK
jgi:hypothetical protein